MDRKKREIKPKEDRLEGLKEARKGGVSRLDLLEVVSPFMIDNSFQYSSCIFTLFILKEEDDNPIFNSYTEEEYEKLVENRRKESNFVVDDSK
jgi:hypothetical protein